MSIFEWFCESVHFAELNGEKKSKHRIIFESAVNEHSFVNQINGELPKKSSHFYLRVGYDEITCMSV